MYDQPDVPPDHDNVVGVTWAASTELPDPVLDAIHREAPVEPRDDACVWWDDQRPGQLNVIIGADGDLEEATFRAARHLRRVLMRHDPAGALVDATGSSETHGMELTDDDLTTPPS